MHVFFIPTRYVCQNTLPDRAGPCIYILIYSRFLKNLKKEMSASIRGIKSVCWRAGFVPTGRYLPAADH